MPPVVKNTDDKPDAVTDKILDVTTKFWLILLVASGSQFGI